MCQYIKIWIVDLFFTSILTVIMSMFLKIYVQRKNIDVWFYFKTVFFQCVVKFSIITLCKLQKSFLVILVFFISSQNVSSSISMIISISMVLQSVGSRLG